MLFFLFRSSSARGVIKGVYYVNNSLVHKKGLHLIKQCTRKILEIGDSSYNN